MKVEFDVDLVEFGENCKYWEQNRIVFGIVLKVNSYVSELLFYNSTQRELSHAGLQLA